MYQLHLLRWGRSTCFYHWLNQLHNHQQHQSLQHFHLAQNFHRAFALLEASAPQLASVDTGRPVDIKHQTQHSLIDVAQAFVVAMHLPLAHQFHLLFAMQLISLNQQYLFHFLIQQLRPLLLTQSHHQYRHQLQTRHRVI